jgi:drug/metabolite transporter (DMT)-like permease
MAMNDNIKGALLMSLSMASFTINDAMVKVVAPDMNAGQIMFVRGLMSSTMILIIAWRLGALRPLSTLKDPRLLLRAFCEVLASLTYVTALSMIPLPNAAAILQALPLAVTMGAALFLGEPVGWRRWAAILVGFCGVLVIIRPGAEGFTLASLLVVGSVLTAGARDLFTKVIDPATPSLFISATTSIAVTLTGGALIVPFGGWQPVGIGHLAALLFGSSMLIIGYQTIILAMRTGEISFIAPFRYTSLIWAILLGIFLLGELPDLWMLVGAAIVIAAGLYAFYREHKLHREIAARRATTPSP